MGMRMWAAAAAMLCASNASAAVIEITLRVKPFVEPINDRVTQYQVNEPFPEIVFLKLGDTLIVNFERLDGSPMYDQPLATSGVILDQTIAPTCCSTHMSLIFHYPAEARGATVGVTRAYAFSASIPEPSTWALMFTGLAGLGFIARRKRAAITA